MQFYQISVSAEFHQERLDIFISKVCSQIPSRSFASKWILGNKVTVNGQVQKPSFKVLLDQLVVIDTSFLNDLSPTPIGEKIPLDILFEDKDIIVINKPAGIVVHPGAGVRTGTLVNAILAHCGSTLPSLGTAMRAGIVHRLDKETSGVMVIAKTQIALTQLAKQFAAHSQKKIYHALVYGVPKNKIDKIETWHGRAKTDRIKFAVQEEGVGKKARMSYSVQQEFFEGGCSLVECQLQTGRTHQIRVQLNSIGNGILGDRLYSSQSSLARTDKKLLSLIKESIHRQMLHASQLEFIHPTENIPMNFVAPLPEDFKLFLKIISENNYVTT